MGLVTFGPTGGRGLVVLRVLAGERVPRQGAADGTTVVEPVERLVDTVFPQGRQRPQQAEFLVPGPAQQGHGGMAGVPASTTP